MVRGILADTASVTNVTKPVHSSLAAGTRRYNRYTRYGVVSHAILKHLKKSLSKKQLHRGPNKRRFSKAIFT